MLIALHRSKFTICPPTAQIKFIGVEGLSTIPPPLCGRIVPVDNH